MYKRLVLCGGGTKCITILGYLQQLIVNGQLDGLECISACSAGAYIAVLYLLGMKPVDMLNLLPTENIKLDMKHLLDLTNRKGLYRVKKFAKGFKKIVRDKLGQNPTMTDLYNYSGVDLYIYTCDITNSVDVYINHITHPDYPLLDVVYASSSVPLIFVPVTINDTKYIDGGIITSIPLQYCNTVDTIILNSTNPNVQSGLLNYIVKLMNTGQQIRQKADLTTFVGKYVLLNSNLGLLEFNGDVMKEFLNGWNQYS